jgi:hypothetical protein
MRLRDPEVGRGSPCCGAVANVHPVAPFEFQREAPPQRGQADAARVPGRQSRAGSGHTRTVRLTTGQRAVGGVLAPLRSRAAGPAMSGATPMHHGVLTTDAATGAGSRRRRDAGPATSFTRSAYPGAAPPCRLFAHELELVLQRDPLGASTLGGQHVAQHLGETAAGPARRPAGPWRVSAKSRTFQRVNRKCGLSLAADGRKFRARQRRLGLRAAMRGRRRRACSSAVKLCGDAPPYTTGPTISRDSSASCKVGLGMRAARRGPDAKQELEQCPGGARSERAATCSATSNRGSRHGSRSSQPTQGWTAPLQEGPPPEEPRGLVGRRPRLPDCHVCVVDAASKCSTHAIKAVAGIRQPEALP